MVKFKLRSSLNLIASILKITLLFVLTISLILQLAILLIILYNECSLLNYVNLLLVIAPVPIALIGIVGLLSTYHKRIFYLILVSIDHNIKQNFLATKPISN